MLQSVGCRVRHNLATEQKQESTPHSLIETKFQFLKNEHGSMVGKENG